MLPLEGIRVLDLTRLLPGPYATLVLADLGADVVKLEEPRSGDYLRWMPPLAGTQSGAFHALNRNKRSVAFDVKAEGGAGVLLRLAGHFDVIVDGFRPGVLDRLGAGHARLRQEHPRLVVCAITGYGQDGPYRDVAGHDLNYCAMAGALALNGTPDAPLPYGVQPADVAGGSWVAVAGILAALLRRATTGEGGVVDVSMTEGVLGMMAIHLGMASAAGRPPARAGGMLSGRSAFYRVYRTRDGRFVALGSLEPQFFAAFCRAAGRAELAERQFDDDGRGPVEEVEAIFASRTRDEWTAFAQQHDVCLTPVLEGDEPYADPQLRARGMFLDVPTPWEGKPMRSLATPVRVDGARAPLRPAPQLGADTDAVLLEAGFAADEIEGLRNRGVVGTHA